MEKNDWQSYRSANRSNWDDRTKVHYHEGGDSYDVEAFLNGESTLLDLELKALGNVEGKLLLHLMCHFGLDTLSWARLGAHVTGVDFSPEAIRKARELTEKSELEATFIESDIYELPDKQIGKFDIVVCTYGTLCWLPDMDRFFSIVADCLKQGGHFLLINDHPFKDMLEYNPETKELELTNAYFHKAEPMKFDSPNSYTNHETPLESTVSYEWTHDLGSIVNKAIASGLKIEHLKEYSFSFYKVWPTMTRDREGRWQLPGYEIPLIFELLCSRT